MNVDVADTAAAETVLLDEAKDLVHPHRRIDKDQGWVPERLRGGASRFGWVPPSRASRFALSRSINAFNPS